ncbi:MAG: gliding motility-associated C-terminal domain-containing protein, partial [Bacteroidota bacterium]
YFSCLECDVYVPNAFTPNFDGINDYFKPFEHDCFFLEYQFRVFDRWGNLVFSSSDPQEFWRGMNGNRPYQMGVYVWSLNYAVDFRGEVVYNQMAGDVTLLY